MEFDSESFNLLGESTGTPFLSNNMIACNWPVLRSAVGMAHVLWSVLVMGYAT